MGLTWLIVGFTILAAKGISIWLCRRLVRQPDDRGRWIHRYRLAKRYHYYSLYPIFAALVYFLGWGWAVQSFLPGGQETPAYLSTGGEFLIIAPFLVCLLGSWACYFEAERAIAFSRTNDTQALPWDSAWRFVAFQARQTLALVAVPVTLLIVQKALIQPLNSVPLAWEWVASFAGVMAAGIVLLTMPWILRLVLGLQPFPEGPLRDRLLATARRVNFRFSNLLIWHTHGHVANAMVAGLFPIPRYVLLSDRLIEDLSPDEVEAVFGHEIGHVKHRHMLLYLAFLMMSMALLGAILLPTLKSLVNGRQDLQMAPFMAMMSAYIFVFFGFLSRRCERQADIYGCRVVSCRQPDCIGHDSTSALSERAANLCPTGINTFIQALEKVADSNGMSRDRPGWLQSWQHSTIARRVDFLARVRMNPLIERRFQRRVFITKCVLFLGLVAGLAAVAQFQGWQALLDEGAETTDNDQHAKGLPAGGDKSAYFSSKGE
jgi:Zn-dependent protease with chaperone function